MKRFLLIYLALIIFSGLNAQNTFSDDFEAYTVGAFLGVSSTKWTTWSGVRGGADDTRVSNEQAHSGTKSIKFLSTSSGGGPADVILPFGGRKTNGVFTLEMWMYVVNGTGAYFNFQGNAAVGQIWSMDAFFDPDGAVRFTLGSGGSASVASGRHTKNLTDNNWEAFVDDISLGSWANPNNAVASMDLYPVSSNNQSTFYVDDVSYNYEPYVPLNLDASFSSVTAKPKNLAGATFPATIKVRNVGVSKITSLEVEWTVNGGTPVVENYTVDLNNLMESAPLPLSQMISYPSGTGNIEFTITKVNGTADDKASNNSRSLAIEGVVPAPNKKIVVEEATGTWCQWCPRGAVYMDSLTKLYPDHFIGIAVHNADPMVHAPYDLGMRSFPGFTGFPSVITNRRTLGDPSGMEPVFFNQIVELSPVALELGAAYDANTRQLNVEVKADFSEDLNGDYRFNLVIVEDGVKGTTSAYNQANAYAGGANGVMGGYELLPNPVPAARMVYNHVGRAIMDGWAGTAGYLPTDIPSGTSYLKAYNFVIPANYIFNNIKLVGMMLDPNGEIINANEVTIDEAIANGLFTSTNQPVSDQTQLMINPNPASDFAIVHFNTTTSTNVSLEIVDLMGRVINRKDYGKLNGAVDLPVQTSILQNGNYLIRLIQDNKIQTQKLIVSH
jgi:hypothetical protein